MQINLKISNMQQMVWSVRTTYNYQELGYMFRLYKDVHPQAKLQVTEKRLMDSFTFLCVKQYRPDFGYCLYPKHVALFFINMYNIECLKH